MKKFLPLRFRKAGKVWCGGAQETHWATCHNGVTPSETKEFLKSFRFVIWYNLYLYGSKRKIVLNENLK